jgi:hypothetical protein
MATPIYKGAGQPLADGGSGLLGRLGSFFGGGTTPAYAGRGQPSAGVTGGFLGGSTPAYAAGPTKPQPIASATDDSSMCSIDAQALTECLPLDADALAKGMVAIVVPRP